MFTATKVNHKCEEDFKGW